MTAHDDAMPDDITDAEAFHFEGEFVTDLLTDDDKATLQADLAEIARLRRRGEAAARDWIMP